MDDLRELLRLLTLYADLSLPFRQGESDDAPSLSRPKLAGEETPFASGRKTTAAIREYAPFTGRRGTEAIGSASPVYGESAGALEKMPLQKAEEISRYFERDARRYG